MFFSDIALWNAALSRFKCRKEVNVSNGRGSDLHHILNLSTVGLLERPKAANIKVTGGYEMSVAAYIE